MATKKMNKYMRSQNAHMRLNRLWQEKSNTAKNRAYGNYHACCIDEQKKLHRVLTRNERKKLFAWNWNYEVNEKRTLYPQFRK